MSNLVKAVPLYLQVRQQLRSDILGGLLAARTKLGTEALLMARFGVSRITVRRALKGLVDEGLVYRVRGGGTFISPRRQRGQRSTQRAGLIGVHAVDLHTALSDFLRELVRAIGHAAEARQVKTTLFLVDPDDPHSSSYAMFEQALGDRRMDGLISTAFLGRGEYLRIQELGVPVVLTFDCDGPDLSVVCVDVFKLFESVASFAVEAGWRTPALVKGPGPVHADELAESGSPLTGIRAVEGFRCGLTRHLRPYLPSHVLRSHYRAEEAPALAQAILGLSPRPDVLIVDGTEMASALAATLSEPMPVLGIGPAVSSPAVAVIEHPTAEVGRRAAEMLLARLERPDAAAEHVFIPIDADRARAAVFAAFERFTGQRACV